MVNRFWVRRADLGSDGTGVWGPTQVGHWSATSGGAGGQSPPTSVDNVFFDGHSGLATADVVVDGPVNCNTLTVQATFAGVIRATSDGIVRPFGNIVLSGKSISCPVRVMDTCIISSGGGKFLSYLNVQPNTAGQTVTISGPLDVASVLYLRGGTLLTQGYNITSSAFAADLEAFPAALNLGSGGTWTITGAGQSWKVIPGIPVVAGIGRIIRLTDATTTVKSFWGGNAAYGTLSLLGGAGVGAYQLINNNSFANIILEKDPTTLLFNAGSSQTITSAGGLQISGVADQRNIFKTDANGTRATLSIPSGDVHADFVNIQDIAATGGATFLANSSINSGNNAGWRFNANEQFFSLL